MDEPQLINGLIVAYTIEVGLAIFAYARLIYLYRKEHGHRSVLWRGLLWIFGISVAVGVGLVPVGLAALLELPRLPFTGPMITLGIMILLGAVIAFWLVVERVRLRHPAIEPEPEPDDDWPTEPTSHTTEEPGR